MIAFIFANRNVTREREIESILSALNVLRMQRASNACPERSRRVHCGEAGRKAGCRKSARPVPIAITSHLPQGHLEELATEEANYRRRARELGAAGL
jgi:hypothetical protein